MAKRRAQQQKAKLNEVPLPLELEKRAEKFLEDVHLSDHSEALVIIIRYDDAKDRVRANVLNTGLTDELANKMATAAMTATAGKPLFTIWG